MTSLKVDLLLASHNAQLAVNLRVKKLEHYNTKFAVFKRTKYKNHKSQQKIGRVFVLVLFLRDYYLKKDL